MCVCVILIARLGFTLLIYKYKKKLSIECNRSQSITHILLERTTRVG